MYIPMVTRDTTNFRESSDADAGPTSDESLWKPSRKEKRRGQLAPMQKSEEITATGFSQLKMNLRT